LGQRTEEKNLPQPGQARRFRSTSAPQLSQKNFGFFTKLFPVYFYGSAETQRTLNDMHYQEADSAAGLDFSVDTGLSLTAAVSVEAAGFSAGADLSAEALSPVLPDLAELPDLALSVT